MANKNRVFSSAKELEQIALTVQNYLLLPFSSFNVPGAVLEQTIALVRKAEVLGKYDFVDIVDKKSQTGWQIKSTMFDTPVTWKRAKIKNRELMIKASRESQDGLQLLGDAIISFCNAHAVKSIQSHRLKEIGYARLVVHKNNTATYFERLLCTADNPEIFNSKDFVWKWSAERSSTTKEQLAALHGTHTKTDKKWFAWHGQGENQLHFNGETTWWPGDEKGANSITFRIPPPENRISFDALQKLLKKNRVLAGLRI